MGSVQHAACGGCQLVHGQVYQLSQLASRVVWTARPAQHADLHRDPLARVHGEPQVPQGAAFRRAGGQGDHSTLLWPAASLAQGRQLVRRDAGRRLLGHSHPAATDQHDSAAPSDGFFMDNWEKNCTSLLRRVSCILSEPKMVASGTTPFSVSAFCALASIPPEVPTLPETFLQRPER